MKALFTALLKAQGEFPVIAKTKTANVPTKSGGKYSYNYADLGSVVDGISPVLAKHSLGIIHKGEGEILTTVLFHAESGESISSSFKMPMSDDPQDMGAVITYYRRYAICALVGVVTEDDTDASTSSKPKGNIAPPKGKPDLKAVSPDLGSFEITFGKNKGKTFEKMGVDGVLQWKNSVIYALEKEGKRAEGKLAEALDAAENFLISRHPNNNRPALSLEELPY